MIARLLFGFLLALPLYAQPFSPQDPVFSQICSPLLQGCVGAWRMEESSGVRYDLSGHNNNLTSNNSVGQTSGVSANTGNCATFTAASSQYLSAASNANLQGSGSFTFCGWLYLTTKTTSGRLVAKWNDPTAAEYIVEYTQSSDRFVFYTTVNNGTSSTNATASSFGSPTAATWYFIAAWHDDPGNAIHIQINNGADDSASFNGTISTGAAEFRVGRLSSTSSVYLNGRVDELHKFNRVLTADEKTGLFRAGLGTHTPWAHP